MNLTHIIYFECNKQDFCEPSCSARGYRLKKRHPLDVRACVWVWQSNPASLEMIDGTLIVRIYTAHVWLFSFSVIRFVFGSDVIWWREGQWSLSSLPFKHEPRSFVKPSPRWPDFRQLPFRVQPRLVVNLFRVQIQFQKQVISSSDPRLVLITKTLIRKRNNFCVRLLFEENGIWESETRERSSIMHKTWLTGDADKKRRECTSLAGMVAGGGNTWPI